MKRHALAIALKPNCAGKPFGHVRRGKSGICRPIEQRLDPSRVDTGIAGNDSQNKAGCLPADLDDQHDTLCSSFNRVPPKGTHLVRLPLWRVIDQSIRRIVGVQQGDEFLIGIRYHRAPPAAAMTSISMLAPKGNAATAIVVRAALP
jgi:hypothetical protein